MEPNDAVVVAVLKMVEAVNRGDFPTAVAAFTGAPVIIEDIAPYVWRGADAPTQWLSAMGANAERLDVQSVLMTLEQPMRIEVDAGAAYALFPGHLSLVAKGSNLLSRGMLTLILLRPENQWLIDSLVWSGPEPAPG